MDQLNMKEELKCVSVAIGILSVMLIGELLMPL